MNIFTLPQTEEAAINFLQSKSILPTNKIYENGHEMKLSIGKQVRWRCLSAFLFLNYLHTLYNLFDFLSKEREKNVGS